MGQVPNRASYGKPPAVDITSTDVKAVIAKTQLSDTSEDTRAPASRVLGQSVTHSPVEHEGQVQGVVPSRPRLHSRKPRGYLGHSVPHAVVALT